MTNQPQINLSRIFQIIVRSWKFILGFILVAMATGLLFYLFGTPKYETKTSFILRDPLEWERNQTLSQDFFQNKRYFADEDNIDEVIALSKSSEMYSTVVDHFKLRDTKGKNAERYLRKNLEIKRNDTREIDISYADSDRKLSADLTNFVRDYLQMKYESYFKTLHQNIILNLQSQIKVLDSSIVVLNDSIRSTRERFGLNVQLLPQRGEALSAPTTASGIDAAMGLEILANHTATKDKLIESRAKMNSLIHEYALGMDEHATLSAFNVTQRAHQDTFTQLPNPKLLFPIMFFAALIVGIIVALIRDYRLSI